MRIPVTCDFAVVLCITDWAVSSADVKRVQITRESQESCRRATIAFKLSLYTRDPRYPTPRRLTSSPLF
jgi:hypothetical protein